MNLRHIDPRSTDWMDAMLEELESKTEGRPKRERGGEKAEGAVHHVVASQGSSSEVLSSGPPPGPR